MEKMALVLVVGAVAIAALPSSPFTYFMGALQKLPYLGILNWFIPISTFISIGQAWLMAIVTYYFLSLILRWIKAIE